MSTENSKTEEEQKETTDKKEANLLETLMKSLQSPTGMLAAGGIALYFYTRWQHYEGLAAQLETEKTALTQKNDHLSQKYKKFKKRLTKSNRPTADRNLGSIEPQHPSNPAFKNHPISSNYLI